MKEEKKEIIGLFCRVCGYKTPIVELVKFKDKRIDLCLKCYNKDNSKLTERKERLMTKSKAPILPTRLSYNAKEIVLHINTKENITNYILASKLSKRKIIQLLLGKSDDGYYNILYAMYFGGTYCAYNGYGQDTRETTKLEPIRSVVESAFNSLTDKKLPKTIVKDKVAKMKSMGLTVEQIIELTPRMTRERIIERFNK